MIRAECELQAEALAEVPAAPHSCSLRKSGEPNSRRH
jgi:hypothetical protein